MYGKQKKAKKDKKDTATFKWSSTSSLHLKELCELKEDVQVEAFKENHTLFFMEVTKMGELVKLLVQQSNLYTQQNGREFLTDGREKVTFLRINTRF